MKRKTHDLRELGNQAGLGYVDYEVVDGQTVYIFQDRPDSRVYQFRVFIFIDEDLTVENMQFCKKHGYSRNIEVTL